MALNVVAVCDKFGQNDKGRKLQRWGSKSMDVLRQKAESSQPSRAVVESLGAVLSACKAQLCSTSRNASLSWVLNPRGQAVSSGHAAKAGALWKVCGERGGLSGHCYLSIRAILAHALLTLCWNLHTNAKSAIILAHVFAESFLVLHTVSLSCLNWWELKSESPVGLCVFSTIFYLAVLS